jgi:uncharacterized protein (DUF1501 family)
MIARRKGDAVLTIWGKRSANDCDDHSRRDFLKVGTLGLTGLTLGGLLRGRAAAAAEGRSPRDTAVVWLWLQGGPSHIETFDPNMDAPAEFRSMVGAVKTTIPRV